MEVPGFVKNLGNNERNRDENEQAGLNAPGFSQVLVKLKRKINSTDKQTNKKKTRQRQEGDGVGVIPFRLISCSDALEKE